MVITLENNTIWFKEYKDMERKILEKNKEIEGLKTKEKQLKREIAIEQQK